MVLFFENNNKKNNNTVYLEILLWLFQAHNRIIYKNIKNDKPNYNFEFFLNLIYIEIQLKKLNFH